MRSTYPGSRNDVWALAELETGLFSACCQNGLGTTRGMTAGLLIVVTHGELGAGRSAVANILSAQTQYAVLIQQ